MEFLRPILRRVVEPSDDSSFGPASGAWFDFTLTFEEIFFGIVPTAILVILAPFFLIGYKKLSVAVAADTHMWAKLITSSIITILEIAVAVLRTTTLDPLRTTAAAHTLTSLAAFVVTVLLFVDHRYAIKSSAIISIYFLITLLFDIARTRSFSIRGGEGSVAVTAAYGALSALKLAIIALTEVPKHYQSTTRQALGKEATSGFWNRTLFIWINSTLFFGFRNRFSVDDLPNLGPDFDSDALASAFEPNWLRYAGSPYRLLKASVRSLKWSFLVVVPVRLLHIGFAFTQPFLIQSALEYFGSDEKSTDTRNALIAAYIITNLGVTLSQVWYQHLNYQLVTHARGTLISQIIRKNLLLNHQEAKKSSASTLISADVAGVASGILKVQDTWACFVEIGLAIYFLYRTVGNGAFFVLVPAALSTGISTELGKRFRVAKKAWNDSIESRVSKTSKILSQVKEIKMMGIESKIANYVQKLREVEVAFSKKTRNVNVAIFSCTPIAYAFTPIIVIAAGVFWTKFTGGLEATSTFATLGFVSMVVEPMLTLLTSWPQIGSCLACVSRIENFLLQEEREDRRALPEDAAETPLADARGDNEESEKQPLDQFPIQFLKASIAPSDSQEAVVHLNAAIEASTLTMVVGPTGCGKSTLLKGAIGEAKILQGSVLVSRKDISYCDEHVWIRNITIRENIVGENAFDEVLYKRVIHACMLADVDEFPNGDLTLAGSGGLTLSGGQKQRIALARGVYNCSDVIVMEDMLSAVDQSSVAVIMDRLFGKASGLMKQLGTTVLMATNSNNHLDHADAILTIDSNGRGTLAAAKRAVTENEEPEEARIDATQNPEAAGEISAANEPRAAAAPKPEAEQEALSSLSPQADWSLWSFYTGSMTKSVFALWIFLNAIGGVVERGPDIFIRIWIEHASQDKNWFIGYAIIGVLCMASMAAITGLFLLRLVPESSERLHRKLIDTVMQATLSFLSYTDRGSLLNRFSQDMSLVSRDLPINLLLFVNTFFIGLVDLGIILAGTRYAFAILPFATGAFSVLQLYYLRSSKQMRVLDIEEQTPLYTLLTEMSDGLQHIRAFGWESAYYAKGLASLDRSQKPYYCMYCIQRWLTLVVGLFVVVISATLISFALTFSVGSQESLGLSMLIAMKVGTVLADVVEYWVELETSLGSISRLASFMKQTPAEVSEDIELSHALPDNWPHRGDIELVDVTSRYSIAASNDGVKNHNVALYDVSTTIEGGTKVGVVGRTGSGKSSLFLTILNCLDYTGQITIDGVEISSVPRHILRSRITTIAQDLISLPCSIRDIVVPWEMDTPANKRIGNAVVLAALGRVGLKEHIETQGGLEADIEDIGLSNGQRQLLALARAIVHNGQTHSKVVLVDEATSGVDAECEEKMHAVMSEVFEGCTVLTIAHRSTAKDSAGMLLEMSGGHLVQNKEQREG